MTRGLYGIFCLVWRHAPALSGSPPRISPGPEERPGGEAHRRFLAPGTGTSSAPSTPPAHDLALAAPDERPTDAVESAHRSRASSSIAGGSLRSGRDAPTRAGGAGGQPPHRQAWLCIHSHERRGTTRTRRTTAASRWTSRSSGSTAQTCCGARELQTTGRPSSRCGWRSALARRPRLPSMAEDGAHVRLSLGREEPLEERPVARESDAEVLGGHVVTPAPLILEAPSLLGERLREAVASARRPARRPAPRRGVARRRTPPAARASASGTARRPRPA